MADMKIGEENEAYSAAAFTFPDNPRVVDVPGNPNRTFMNVPYGKMHICNDFGGADPKLIALNGEFRGTTRNTSYDSLTEHIYDPNIKKFFISDTRFYYVLGQTCKKTHSGDRTNFVDYVATLWTPIPYSFSDDSRTYTVSFTDAAEHTLNDATAGSTGAFLNAGDAPSFVKWQIVNAAGNSITKVEIGDTSTLAGSTRRIEWTGTLASGKTLIVYMMKFVTQTGGQKYLQYGWPEIDSAHSGNMTLPGQTTGLPYVTGGQTDQAFSIKLTGNSSTANITALWRDAYYS
jgi:hypothetical protein